MYKPKSYANMPRPAVFQDIRPASSQRRRVSVAAQAAPTGSSTGTLDGLRSRLRTVAKPLTPMPDAHVTSPSVRSVSTRPATLGARQPVSAQSSLRTAGRPQRSPALTPTKTKPKNHTPPKARRKLVIAKAVVCAMVIIVASGLVWSHRQRPVAAQAVAGAKTATPSVAEQPKPRPVKTLTTDDQMAAAIQSTIATHRNLEIAVSIVDINHGTTYHYGLNSSIVYEAASVAKLITATCYLSLVDQNGAAMTTVIGGKPAKDQLSLMITDSDNDAWHALNDYLTHDRLSQFAAQAGITHYNPESNTLTPDDIAQLLAKVQQQKILSATSNSFLLGLMKGANRQDLILAALPSGVTGYHKAGWLADRTHDAAIIDDGYDPYVLVVFIKSSLATGDEPNRLDVIHTVTSTTTKRFIGA